MEPMPDMSMLGMGASGFPSCGSTGMARSAAMDIPNAKHPTAGPCALSKPMAPPAPRTSCAAVKVHPPSAADSSNISCTATEDAHLTTASATATSTVPTAGTVVTTAILPPQETPTQAPVSVKVEDTSAIAVDPPQAEVPSAPSPAPSPAAAAVKAQVSGPAKPVPIKKDELTGKKHYVGAYSPESRRLRLERFWEKKKNRIWQRKVKYDVRKEFAESRIRVKGRFVKKEDEAILTSLLGCVPPPIDAPRPEPALTGYPDPSLISYEAPVFDYPPPPPINYTEAGANRYTDLGPSGYTGTGF